MKQSDDQEFLSNVFSNFHPLLYDLPQKHQYIRMGSLGPKESASRNVSSTLLHIPAIAQLWGEEEKKKDNELINVLLPVALESVRWFRKHAQVSNFWSLISLGWIKYLAAKSKALETASTI